MTELLVVEDEHLIQESLRDLFEDEGYVVHTANNGAEALDTLKTAHPAVIVLDLMMPIMDGWSFLRTRLQDPAARAVPVIVLSASHLVDSAALQALQVAAHVRKPFELDEMVQHVQALLHP